MLHFNHFVFFIPSWQHDHLHKVKCNVLLQFSSDTGGLCRLTAHSTPLTSITSLSPQTACTDVQLATHSVVPTSSAKFCNLLELTEFRNTVSVHLIKRDPSWELPNKGASRERSGRVSDGILCVISQWNQDCQPLCYGFTMKCLLNAHVLNVWSPGSSAIWKILETLGCGF